MAITAALILECLVPTVGHTARLSGNATVTDCGAFASFSSCATNPDTTGKSLLITRKFTTKGLTINNRHLVFTPGGRLVITDGTVTHNGNFDAPLTRVIEGQGRFRFGTDSSVRKVFPQWFGLEATAADNTEALQKAIDSLPGGGTVALTGAGTYLTNRIIPRSGVNIIGNSHDVILKLNNGQNTDIIREEYTRPVRNVRISGFSIDGNKAHNPSKYAGTAIQFGGTDIEIDNMRIFNTAAAGIILGIPTGGGRYTIRDNDIRNASVDGIGWGAIAVTGGDDVLIANNRAVSDDGYQAYGIDLEPNPGWVIRRVRITGNSVSRGRISVGVNYPNATTESVTIENNRVDCHGAWGSSFDSGSAMYAKNITGYLTIRNNEFFAPDQSPGGIRIENSDNFTVENNIVHVRDHAAKGSEFGLWVIDSRHGRIKGNSFRAVTGHTPRFGIYETGSSDYNTYGSNVFSGFATNRVLKGAHNLDE